MVCYRQNISRTHVLATNASEALLGGVGQRPGPVLDLKKEVRSPISLANVFETVADDLLTLNQNLQSLILATQTGDLSQLVAELVEENTDTVEELQGEALMHKT